ncbi:MAG: hypothetical protein J0H17_13855 [Rhizobiales bacterium]|nr:hypothetical protein [Hyphomicrobiales bacterium]
MTGRDLARHAFWSEHPLCDLYAVANGVWIAGKFRPATKWSLRELIAFAETLPPTIINQISGPQT